MGALIMWNIITLDGNSKEQKVGIFLFMKQCGGQS